MPTLLTSELAPGTKRTEPKEENHFVRVCTGKSVNDKNISGGEEGRSTLCVKIMLSCCMPVQIAAVLWFLDTKWEGQAGFKGEALLKERGWNAV